MQKNEIEIGKAYLAKVTNRLVSVKIVGPNPHGGWNAINLATGKAVRIKTAGRLRGPAPQTAETASALPATDGRTNATDEQPSNATSAPAERHTAQPAARPTPSGRMSLLDAAIEMLRIEERPMKIGEMLDLAVGTGRWTPGDGKTPANTLAAALQKELKRGDSRRVEKIDRGLFALRTTA